MSLQPPLPPLEAPPAGFVERRRGYRQAIRASVLLRTVATATESRSLPVHVFEHSISGVGFSAATALAIGTIWRFDMCDKRQINRRIEVRSCRARRDDMFDIGAMFC